jgi:general stress protein CsbA
MKKTINKFKERWRAKSPLVFKRITNICVSISAMSVAIHTACITAGAVEPYWYVLIYPYVVGASTGMAFVAKMTQERKEEDKNEKDK